MSYTPNILQTLCSDRASSYLEVIMKSIAAAVFFAPTGIKVVAKFAGSISAVHQELRTDCAVPIPTSIPHNTGT